MFLALLGDKDISDPESPIESEEEDTTSKESNIKNPFADADADAVTHRSTNSLHNDNIDRTPTPSFFEDID